MVQSLKEGSVQRGMSDGHLMGKSLTMDMKECRTGSYYQLLLKMAMDMVALPSAHDCLHSYATLPKVPQQLLLDREYPCKGAPGSTMQHHIFKPTRPYFLASDSRLFCRIYGICLFVFVRILGKYQYVGVYAGKFSRNV